MFNTLSLLFHGKSRILDENIKIKPNIMPNFNKYETKANTTYGDIARKKAMIVTENILPTPFPKTVTKEYKDEILKSSKINKEYRIITEKITGRDYLSSSTILGVISLNWDIAAFRIYNYIHLHLKYNSNSIMIKYEDFRGYCGMGESSFTSGLNCLIRPNVDYSATGDASALLAKTTKKSLYIVNHNLLFKGDYEFFIECLNDKYPNGYELDSNGKVVIRN